MQLKPKQPPKHNSRQTRTKRTAMPKPCQLDLTSMFSLHFGLMYFLERTFIENCSEVRVRSDWSMRTNFEFQSSFILLTLPELGLIHSWSRTFFNLKVPTAPGQALVFEFRTQAMLPGFSLRCASGLTNDTRCGANGSARVSLSGLRR